VACLVECPQLARADKERRNPKSQFDPKPTSLNVVATRVHWQ
jgi:hypothetical protein